MWLVSKIGLFSSTLTLWIQTNEYVAGGNKKQQQNTKKNSKLKVPNYTNTDAFPYWQQAVQTKTISFSIQQRLWGCPRRAATWKASVENNTWSKSRSAVSTIHCDGSIFLKIFPCTLVSNVFSDTRLIFMLCLQQSSITDSVLCLRKEGMHMCTCFYVLQRALRWSWLWRHCTNLYTMAKSEQKENRLPRYWTFNLNHKGRRQALIQEQVAFCS